MRWEQEREESKMNRHDEHELREMETALHNKMIGMFVMAMLGKHLRDGSPGEPPQ